MDPLFSDAALAFGVVLLLGALVGALLNRSLLSLAGLFVLFGLAIGPVGLNLVAFDPRSDFVAELGIVALIVILFRDGLEVDRELLHSHWHWPARKLLLAMPLTAIIVTLAALTLTDLSVLEALLVGALLSPTDPVLTSQIIGSRRVPERLRHSLGLESGFNDGLVLPVVLFLLVLLGAEGEQTPPLLLFLEDIGFGLLAGIAVGALAARLDRWAQSWLPRGRALVNHEIALYGLGVALSAYGLAGLFPHGNGLIAVFVAAICLGVLRPDLATGFAWSAQPIAEIVKAGVFLVFGACLSWSLLTSATPALIAVAVISMVLARPFAIVVSMFGSRADLGTRLWFGWFGPKGVATIAFGLVVLGADIARSREIFATAAIAVLISIFVHGATSAWGARWIEAHELKQQGDE